MSITEHLTPDQKIAIRQAIEVTTAWNDPSIFVDLMRTKTQEEIGMALAGMKGLLELTFVWLDMKLRKEGWSDGQAKVLFIQQIAKELAEEV